MAISLNVDIREVDYSPDRGTETLRVIATVTTTGETYNTTGNASGYMALDIMGSVLDAKNASFTCSFGRNTTTEIFNQVYTVNRGTSATAAAKVTLTTGTSAGTISKVVERTLMSSGNNIEILGLSTSSNNYMDSTYTVRLAYPLFATRADVYVQSFGTLPAGGRTIATDTTSSDIPWTPTTAQFAPYCTDSQSATCTVRVDFKRSDGSKVSSFDASFLLVVPQSVRPTVTTYLEDATGILDDYGVITPTSDVTVVAEATALYGASISSVYLMTNGVRYDLSHESGNRYTWHIGTSRPFIADSYEARALDSRGRTGYSSTTDVDVGTDGTVLVDRVTAKRVTGSSEDLNSSTVQVSVIYYLYGTNQSSLSGTMTISYRRVGSSSWSSAGSASVSGGAGKTYTRTLTNLSSTYSWEIQAQLTSGGKTSRATFVLSTGAPIMDFATGGKAISMWGVADTGWDGFDLNGALTIRDSIYTGLGDSRYEAASIDQSNGRLVFENHTGMANAMWHQLQLSNGSLFNFARMSADDQLEFNWPTGGIRGSMWKRLWTGTWSSGQSSSITDLQKYNLLILVAGGSWTGQRVPVWRHPAYSSSGDFESQKYSWGGAGAATYHGSVGSSVESYLLLSSLSGSDNRLNANSYSPITVYSLRSGVYVGFGEAPVTEIWGVI